MTLLLALLLSACKPVQPRPRPQQSHRQGVGGLDQPSGSAIVSARGNHFVIDWPGAPAGPNEEVNPLDALLAILGTCGIFIAHNYPRLGEEP